MFLIVFILHYCHEPSLREKKEHRNSMDFLFLLKEHVVCVMPTFFLNGNVYQ